MKHMPKIVVLQAIIMYSRETDENIVDEDDNKLYIFYNY